VGWAVAVANRRARADVGAMDVADVGGHTSSQGWFRRACLNGAVWLDQFFRFVCATR
jgi:hypothetical protein